MKTFNLGLVTSAMELSALLLNLNSCKKQDQKDTSDIVSNNNETTEVVNHILDFKKKMEYYRNNPNVKSSSTSYSADSATLELESLINYNFCYTDAICTDTTLTTSEVIMPLDLFDRINDPELMKVYYNKVIDTIQAQMLRINYSKMKLLLVDLEQSGFDSNGDAIVIIKSMIGKPGNIPTEEYGWWFGKYAGTCQGMIPEYGPMDATDMIRLTINSIKLPTVPSNKILRKTNILILPTFIPEDWIFDENDMDNYKDSRLFYAKEDYGTITDETCCLSGSDLPDSGMSFYSESYVQFVTDTEYDNNLEYTECSIDWFETNDPVTSKQTMIWHELTVTLGNVWLIDKDSIIIDDILTY